MAISSTRQKILGLVTMLVITSAVSGAVVAQESTAAAATPPLSISPSQPMVNEATVGAAPAPTAATALSAARPRQPTASQRLGAGRTLTFKDNFTGTRLDTSKWGVREQPYHGNRMCARPAANRVQVGGGVARLTVRKIADFRRQNGRKICTARGVWDNPMIGTARGSRPFLQRNGVFAARVAFQGAQGMHGGFWLQGPGGPSSAEIDIAEFFGVGSPSPLMSKIHYTPRPGVLRSATTKNLVPKLRGRKAVGWNVYSVEWTPTRYVFRINGHVTWRTKQPHVSTAQQEIVLSLLTSDWELKSLKRPKSAMKVDWVRAWA